MNFVRERFNVLQRSTKLFGDEIVRNSLIRSKTGGLSFEMKVFRIAQRKQPDASLGWVYKKFEPRKRSLPSSQVYPYVNVYTSIPKHDWSWSHQRCPWIVCHSKS